MKYIWFIEISNNGFEQWNHWQIVKLKSVRWCLCCQTQHSSGLLLLLFIFIIQTRISTTVSSIPLRYESLYAQAWVFIWSAFVVVHFHNSNKDIHNCFLYSLTLWIAICTMYFPDWIVQFYDYTSRSIIKHKCSIIRNLKLKSMVRLWDVIIRSCITISEFCISSQTDH